MRNKTPKEYKEKFHKELEDAYNWKTHAQALEKTKQRETANNLYLEIDFNFIKSLFEISENDLMKKDLVLFSKRMYLGEIYKQLTEEHKQEINAECPSLIKLLTETNSI